jgi:hypothetical protein
MVRQFSGHARLANTWLTHQHHQASSAGQRVLQGCL